MHRTLIALAVACGVAALFTPAQAATLVTVPGGTVVQVKVVDPVSSATANVGDVFQIKAAQDIVVDGWIVIPKDSPGQGVVTSVDRAGSHGHSGSLGLQFSWMYSADGGKIKLSNLNHNTAEGHKSGASSTATIGTTLLLGPVGLFAHNFVHGKEVVVDSSRALPIYVDSTVHVNAKHKAGAESGFDK